MSQRHQPIIFGTQPDGTPVAYDPPRHGHLTVLGGTGTGKTEVLRTLAAAAHERDDLFCILDAQDIGAFDACDNAMSASTPRSADTLLGNIASVVQDRHTLLDDHGVEHVVELPPERQPKPALVILDDVAELLEASNHREDRHRLADALHVLLRSGHATGVCVAMATQHDDQVHLLNPDSGALVRMHKPHVAGSTGPGRGFFQAGPGKVPVQVRCSMLAAPNV